MAPVPTLFIVIGASKPGIRISQSPNNSGELPYTESGKKLKDQISSFSSYEKGTCHTLFSMHS